jgi:hypothetical protein
VGAPPFLSPAGPVDVEPLERPPRAA